MFVLPYGSSESRELNSQSCTHPQYAPDNKQGFDKGPVELDTLQSGIVFDIHFNAHEYAADSANPISST